MNQLQLAREELESIDRALADHSAQVKDLHFKMTVLRERGEKLKRFIELGQSLFAPGLERGVAVLPKGQEAGLGPVARMVADHARGSGLTLNSVPPVLPAYLGTEPPPSSLGHRAPEVFGPGALALPVGSGACGLGPLAQIAQSLGRADSDAKAVAAVEAAMPYAAADRLEELTGSLAVRLDMLDSRATAALDAASDVVHAQFAKIAGLDVESMPRATNRRRVADAAVELLRLMGPQSARDLLRLLQDRGLELGGENQQAALSVLLSKDDRFVSDRTIGKWKLAKAKEKGLSGGGTPDKP